MARKGPIKKAEISADTKYNNRIVAKFINAIMLDGKKSVAETVRFFKINVNFIKICKQISLRVVPGPHELPPERKRFEAAINDKLER